MYERYLLPLGQVNIHVMMIAMLFLGDLEGVRKGYDCLHDETLFVI
jgi:hypothetical protein